MSLQTPPCCVKVNIVRFQQQTRQGILRSLDVRGSGLMLDKASLSLRSARGLDTGQSLSKVLAKLAAYMNACEVRR